MKAVLCKQFGPPDSLVIESVGMPLSAPIDALGRFVQMSLQVTMSTHQSWDKSDWQATRRI